MNMPSKGTMRSGKSLPYILAVTSGLLFTAGLPGYDVCPAAFLAMVPLLFALREKSLGQSVAVAFTAGLTMAIAYSDWSTHASLRYSGLLSSGTILIRLGVCLYHAIWYGAAGAAYFFLVGRKRMSVWSTVILTAAIWIAVEWAHQNTFSSFPWMLLFPYTQTNNLYLLQWTSLGGTWVVTLAVVGFGALLFAALERRSIKPAIVAAAILVVVHAAGYFMYKNAEETAHHSVRVALLQENINAESRWDDAFVDSLAHILLGLNRQAVTIKPELIVWSETAIPWTFRTDDDLVKEALKITHSTGASHLIGMLTQADQHGDVYNSMYYVEPDGKVSGRYDKQQLLVFLEKPFVSWELPFAQSRYSNLVEGTRPNTLSTRYATLGAMICNETLAPYTAARAARKGAQALIAASNDAWFEGTDLMITHFALTRLRAIETRKDIAVNANRGISGIIRASGTTEQYPTSTIPRCIAIDLHLNDSTTFAAMYPDFLPFVTLAGLCFQIIQATIHHS